MENEEVPILPTLHMAVDKAQKGIKCLQESSFHFRTLGLISQTEFAHICDSTDKVSEQMEGLLHLPPQSAAKAQFNSPLQTSRKTPAYQNKAPTPASSPRGKLRPKKLTYPQPKKRLVGSKVKVWFVDPDVNPEVDQNTLTAKDLKSYSGKIIAVRKNNKRSHLIEYDAEPDSKDREQIWENITYLRRNGLITFNDE
jgi:hypothetical protein